MDRRTFVRTSVLSVLAEPLVAEAQTASRVFRVGLLVPATLPDAAPYIDAFRSGLRDLKWVEGRNIVLEVRLAEGHDERFRGLADELVRLRMDVIVVTGDFGGRAARQATATIPIVMCPNSDPVGTGLVESLARPGGNVTGLSMMSFEFTVKQLQLLLEVAPKVKGVAMLWNPEFPSADGVVKETERGAQMLGVRLQSLPVRDAQEFERAFSSMARERVGALHVIGSPFMFIHRKTIIDLAARGRLPAIYDVREFAELGGLMSYGPSLTDLYRRAAGYVDKILRGVKPRDLPVEQPTKFDLLINLKTARALGLTIPPALLLRADQVIE